VDPVVATWVPAAQLVQAVEPVAAANLPAAQAVHAAWPTADVYLPAAQFEHVVVPESAKVPATQLLHAEELAPAVVLRYLPVAQAWHEVVVVKDWKKPVEHATHAVAPVADW